MNQNQLLAIAIVLGFAATIGVLLFYYYRSVKLRFSVDKDSKHIDHETGLLESSQFHHLVSASVEAFERYQAPFTLLILNYDVRNLGKMPRDEKKETISRLGKKVKGSIRQTDQAGRPSDDSVAILLCNTDESGSKFVSRRITTVFEKVLPDSKVKLTTWSTPDDIGLMRLYINSETFEEKTN